MRAPTVDVTSTEVVAAVRTYLDGGQVDGDTLPAISRRLGVPVSRLLGVMRMLFDPQLEERPSVLVVPARWR